MKLHLSILEKLIELPSKDARELWHLFDDVGLVVKSIEEGGASGTVFTIETLANRGDHLSVLGVARELSARLLTSVKHPPLVAELPERKSSIPIKNLTTLCMRYALLELTLDATLKLRPEISNVIGPSERHPLVDTLNYILLELGQPMHAFDRDAIEGEIIVRTTDKATEVEALDNKTYTVPPGSIVICDKKKIVAVAGVIGCANSMTQPSSKRVLIESALFDPVSVRKTARAMGISTEASYAFERGCDAEGVFSGLKRLVYLVSQSDSSAAHVVGLSQVDGQLPQAPRITLRLDNLRAQIGMPRLPEVEVATRLKNLGYRIELKAGTKEFEVNPPSWRVWDVKNEEDLVEDFVRAHGLNKVKLVLPPLDYEEAEPNSVELVQSRVEKVLHGGGFHEVITKSFQSAEDVSLLSELNPDLEREHLQIKGALETSYSHVKLTNILSLARLAEQNHRRGVLSFKVYEIGRLFSRTRPAHSEYEHELDTLTLAISGRWYEHEFRKAETSQELMLLTKGVLEGIFVSLGARLELKPSKQNLLHPGYQAGLHCGKSECGFFGLVHPLIKERLDLRHDLIYAELKVPLLVEIIREASFKAVSDFPAVRRDITLKLDAKAFSAELARHIGELDEPNLHSVEVVDDFKKPEEDFRRTTYRITFQSFERTLESAEVDQALERILTTLNRKYQVSLA